MSKVLVFKIVKQPFNLDLTVLFKVMLNTEDERFGDKTPI